jgi:hypothetical protein
MASLIAWNFLTSMCQKASKAYMTSGLIIAHATWRKQMVNPSGPDALSEGRERMTRYTSSSVNLSDSSNRLLLQHVEERISSIFREEGPLEGE